VKKQVHTSDLLTHLMNEAPKDTVDLDWLLGHLQKRAFGTVDVTKRAVGLLVLLLAISGIWPLPLINVLPAFTIALLAIAYLQEDGLLLAVSFVIGILSLVIFGFLIWTSAGVLESLIGGWPYLPWRKG
jgi:hypothetical protein